MSGKQGKLRYEDLLRAVGAHLDGVGAHAVVILETLDGFAVRYRRDGDVPLLDTLRYEDLAGRSVVRQAVTEPGGYQDFLRALGHELDDDGARGVLLDQVERGYLLTYQYVDARQGFHVLKRTLMLDSTAQVEILQSAKSRRAEITPDRGGLFSWMTR